MERKRTIRSSPFPSVSPLSRTCTISRRSSRTRSSSSSISSRRTSCSKESKRARTAGPTLPWPGASFRSRRSVSRSSRRRSPARVEIEGKMATQMLDALHRPLRDLRISVTDRCNFRCVYCMPKEAFGPDFTFLPHHEVLTFEEIARLARIFVSLGVEKIRLTGGEPLVRRDLHRLIAMLSEIGGVRDLTLTTNGSLLAKQAQQLARAGLRRITVSLDALDDTIFRAMNDVDFPVQRVLDGISAAREAGLAPIKVNMVVKRGLNDGSIVEMARYFRGSGVVLRFIEYMDVGNTNGWRMDDVVPAAEIVRAIDGIFPLEPVNPNYPGE